MLFEHVAFKSSPFVYSHEMVDIKYYNFSKSLYTVVDKARFILRCFSRIYNITWVWHDCIRWKRCFIQVFWTCMANIKLHLHTRNFLIYPEVHASWLDITHVPRGTKEILINFSISISLYIVFTLKSKQSYKDHTLTLYIVSNSTQFYV